VVVPEEFPAESTGQAPAASLRARLASLVYEVLLLTAILFVFSYLFLVLARDAQSGLMRTFFQVYLLAICGIYFVFCWTRTGQTLPMKTWRLRVVPRGAGRLSPQRALWRYLLAIPGMFSGASVLWAVFDGDHQFLHDRLAGTRIVRVGADPVNGER
jgi:uncharacterized RDD family membrane protein YckC